MCRTFHMPHFPLDLSPSFTSLKGCVIVYTIFTHSVCCKDQGFNFPQSSVKTLKPQARFISSVETRHNCNWKPDSARVLELTHQQLFRPPDHMPASKSQAKRVFQGFLTDHTKPPLMVLLWPSEANQMPLCTKQHWTQLPCRSASEYLENQQLLQ